jgi:hypothetical protein
VQLIKTLSKETQRLIKQGELLKSLSEGNDEVQVLRAMHAMNYLGINRGE